MIQAEEVPTTGAWLSYHDAIAEFLVSNNRLNQETVSDFFTTKLAPDPSAVQTALVIEWEAENALLQLSAFILSQYGTANTQCKQSKIDSLWWGSVRGFIAKLALRVKWDAATLTYTAPTVTEKAMRESLLPQSGLGFKEGVRAADVVEDINSFLTACAEAGLECKDDKSRLSHAAKLLMRVLFNCAVSIGRQLIVLKETLQSLVSSRAAISSIKMGCKTAIYGLDTVQFKRLVEPTRGFTQKIYDVRCHNAKPVPLTTELNPNGPTMVVGGDSGTGKTTLLTQLAVMAAEKFPGSHLCLTAMLCPLTKPQAKKAPKDVPESATGTGPGFIHTLKVKELLTSIKKSGPKSLNSANYAALFDDIMKQGQFDANLVEHVRSSKTSFVNRVRGTCLSLSGTDVEKWDTIVRNAVWSYHILACVHSALGNETFQLLVQDHSTKIVFVAAVDEAGGHTEMLKALCASKSFIKTLLFGPNRDNVDFYLVVAGTGVDTADSPPGSLPETYNIVTCKDTEAHVLITRLTTHQLYKTYADRIKQVLETINSHPFLRDLSNNARVAALLAKKLLREVGGSDGYGFCFRPEWVTSESLIGLAISAVKEFRLRNGLKTVRTPDKVLWILQQCLQLYLYPKEISNSKIVNKLSCTYGVVTDNAVWETLTKEQEKDHHVWARSEKTSECLVTGAGKPRITGNRSSFAILVALWLGEVLESSVTGEGMEKSGMFTQLLWIIASQGMPMDVMLNALRTGKPQFPSDDNPKMKNKKKTKTDVPHFPTVQSVAVVYPEKISELFATPVPVANEDEPAHVLAILMPPKFPSADAVVGVSGKLLALIQSKDYAKTALTISSFYNELFKMGHRSPESIAGHFATCWRDRRYLYLHDFSACVNWLWMKPISETTAEKLKACTSNRKKVSLIQKKVGADGLMHLLLACCPAAQRTTSKNLDACLKPTFEMEDTKKGKKMVPKPLLKESTAEEDSPSFPTRPWAKNWFVGAAGGATMALCTEKTSAFQPLLEVLFPGRQLRRCPVVRKRLRDEDKEDDDDASEESSSEEDADPPTETDLSRGIKKPSDWGLKFQTLFHVEEKSAKGYNPVQYVFHCTKEAAKHFVDANGKVKGELLPPNVCIVLCDTDEKVFDGVVPIGKRVRRHFVNQLGEETDSEDGERDPPEGFHLIEGEDEEEEEEYK